MNYIRVTEPLSRFKTFDFVPEKKLTYVSDRGVRVHRFLHLYANNMLYNDVDFDCLGYVQAGVNFLDDFVEKVYFLEKRFYSNKLLITGQVDLIAKIKGDKHLTLVDYKTCSSTCKTWGLQTAAYMALCQEAGLPVKRRMVLQLDIEENFRVHEFSNFEEDLNVYIGILNAYRYFQ